MWHFVLFRPLKADKQKARHKQYDCSDQKENQKGQKRVTIQKSSLFFQNSLEIQCNLSLTTGKQPGHVKSIL